MRTIIHFLIAFSISILFLPSISAQNVSGLYKTDFNELTISQNGNHVTGNYKHSNGRIDGTLNGNTLTGWWYQDNGKGRFVFVFNSDFSAFTGKWGYNDAEPSGKWNGNKIGVQSSTTYNSPQISGVFNTDFNELTVSQNGNRVTGNYKHSNGRIDGTLNGNTLTGWWYQDNGKGRFVFVFNSDFSAFSGKWGYNDAEPSGKWNGNKTGVQSSTTYNSPQISGVFNTDFNELTVSQNGNRVTGNYKHSNGRIDGTLNGNTLTGWWYQDNGKGRFVFVFNSDFSAFTGKWGYNDAEPSGKWNGQKK